MLIWQSHVNVDVKPPSAWAAEDGEPAACIGLSRRGCWEVMGPVVRRPPQTGPKQPAGGIEEAPCCTDWPDSSDSSGEDWLSTGRWEEGYLSSCSGTPYSLPCNTPQSLIMCLRCLHLTAFLALRSSAGSWTSFEQLYSPHRGLSWTSARILSTPLPL